MTTQTIQYNSYEEMINQYHNFAAIISRAKELGYNFNYILTTRKNEIQIIIKQELKLN